MPCGRRKRPPENVAIDIFDVFTIVTVTARRLRSPVSLYASLPIKIDLSIWKKDVFVIFDHQVRTGQVCTLIPTWPKLLVKDI